MGQVEIDYKRTLMNFLTFIHDNIGDDRLLHKAIDATYVSKFHFYRLFKAVMGMSVNNYIKKIRMYYVSKDLIETELGVLDIAIKYGFSSNEVLTRNFKKEFGVTPVAFRKKGQIIAPLTTPDFFALDLDISAKDGAVFIDDAIIQIKKLTLVGMVRDSSDHLVDTILPHIESFLNEVKAIDYIVTSTIYRICFDLEVIDDVPTFKEFIGVEVSRTDHIPKNMIIKEMSNIKAIQFTHKGKLFLDDRCTVLNTYDMIYKYRIPANHRRLTNECIIEQYGQDFLGPFSEESRFNILMSIE